jgi:uncharacterized protein
VPVVSSSYLPPRFLRHGHTATILSSFFPAGPDQWSAFERLELPDSDFLDLAWMLHPAPQPAPLAILSHGLEGSFNAPYIRSLARTLHAAGWNILAWNYRSCGGIPNRLPQSYHSGASDDLRLVVSHAAPLASTIALVGFSLGGNLTLKYAAESPPHPAVSAAIAVSAPVHLASSAQALDQPRNRLYLLRFLRSLIPKALAKARQFPGSLNPSNLRSIRSIHDFDHRVTAPLHGFSSAEDYWHRASALPLLPNLAIPSLLLNALDDPLLATPSFPDSIAAPHPLFHMESSRFGGHVGFPDPARGWQRWHDRRILDFLTQHSHTPATPAS